MNPLMIRLGNLDDIEDIKNLFRSELDREPNHALIVSALRGYPSVLLHDGEKLVGFAYCLYMAPDVVELANITIQKHHRSSGWGSQMLSLLEKHLIPHTSAIILSNSNLYGLHKTPATAFYERNGYQIIAATGETSFFWKKIS